MAIFNDDFYVSSYWNKLKYGLFFIGGVALIGATILLFNFTAPVVFNHFFLIQILCALTVGIGICGMALFSHASSTMLSPSTLNLLAGLTLIATIIALIVFAIMMDMFSPGTFFILCGYSLVIASYDAANKERDRNQRAFPEGRSLQAAPSCAPQRREIQAEEEAERSLLSGAKIESGKNKLHSEASLCTLGSTHSSCS